MRKAVALLCAVAAIGLVACGGNDDGSTAREATEATTQKSNGSDTAAKAKPSIPTIVIKDGEPVGGVQELEYSAGDQIRFEVRSDIADEIHIHGYDLMKDVPAGGAVSFTFPAEIEGIFEVELEDRAEQIAELRVNP
jgi:hypothetical protein